MVNPSKAKDPRSWAKWRASGAVGTMRDAYRDSRLRESRDALPNLAGRKKADSYIRAELTEAGIGLVEGIHSKGEVPYTIAGKMGDWTLGRAWHYWVARADGNGGLPVDVATELHNRPYPLKTVGRFDKFDTYGKAVRVAGHCGCPAPIEWAHHFDADGRELALDPTGEEEAKWNKFVGEGIISPDYEAPRFVPSLDGVVANSVVGSYHIDSQEGLNAFAEAVRSHG